MSVTWMEDAHPRWRRMLRLRERGSDPGALLSRGVGAVYGGHDLGRGTPGRSAGKTAGEKLEGDLADEKGKKGKYGLPGPDRGCGTSHGTDSSSDAAGGCIVYDALISAEILSLIPPDTRTIYVGKRVGPSSWFLRKRLTRFSFGRPSWVIMCCGSKAVIPLYLAGAARRLRCLEMPVLTLRLCRV